MPVHTVCDDLLTLEAFIPYLKYPVLFIHEDNIDQDYYVFYY